VVTVCDAYLSVRDQVAKIEMSAIKNHKDCRREMLGKLTDRGEWRTTLASAAVMTEGRGRQSLQPSR